MQHFNTIAAAQNHAPIDTETFLETLGEMSAALEYAARAARDNFPVSAEYLARTHARAVIAEAHALTLVNRSLWQNGKWFAIGLIVATATQFGMIWLGSGR